MGAQCFPLKKYKAQARWQHIWWDSIEIFVVCLRIKTYMMCVILAFKWQSKVRWDSISHHTTQPIPRLDKDARALFMVKYESGTGIIWTDSTQISRSRVNMTYRTYRVVSECVSFKAASNCLSVLSRCFSLMWEDNTEWCLSGHVSRFVVVRVDLSIAFQRNNCKCLGHKCGDDKL